jgi:formylglycine-generating enzyme required for sulfatase activity
MARIFISYARKDKPIAEEYVRQLRTVYEHGDVWYDADLHGGKNWWKFILRQVDQCEVFVYLISNRSLQSQYCQWELQYAVEQGKQILPVIIRSRTNLNKAPDPTRRVIQQVQYIETYRLGTGNEVTRLFASVRRLLGEGTGEYPTDAANQKYTVGGNVDATYANFGGTININNPPNMRDPGGNNNTVLITVALIGAAATIIAALIGRQPPVPTIPTDTPTVTDTPTDTTPTAPPSPTPDATEIAAAIATADAELTELAATDIPTPTNTPSNTPTITPSATLTPAPPDTATPLNAVDATLTAIVLELELDTQTEAARVAPTETAWATETLVAGETATQNAVATAVARGIRNATATQYAVETEVIERLATLVTWTPTPTHTPTPTATHSPSNTPTATYTPTATLTPTNTATPTNTPNATATLLAYRPPTNADWTPIERDFDGVTMVLVPAGCFMMGSNERDDEKPVHEQCFDEPFWIDKYEVTNAQIGSTGCTDRSSEPDQPRNCITWFDAVEHCESRGARLPTEREWEYAARGPDSWDYPWGEEWNPDNANWRGTEPNETFPVGRFPDGVSWVGAHDMSGNVWEWVSSLYQPYEYDALDGREDMTNRTDVRVLRGGSFGVASFFLRSADRFRGDPVVGGVSLGFRCARS